MISGLELRNRRRQMDEILCDEADEEVDHFYDDADDAQFDPASIVTNLCKITKNRYSEV